MNQKTLKLAKNKPIFKARRPGRETIMSGDIKKILYVDDDHGCLKLMKSHLTTNYAFELDTFDSPEKALDHVYNLTDAKDPRWYDLIFLDVRLPIMHADLLTKLIKETELNLVNKPIVAITAYLDEDVEKQLAEVEIIDIIEKPITMEKLAPIIMKHLHILPKNDYYP
jgi:response regulator RpfG family c-di-GMP phosphodiesterase